MLMNAPANRPKQRRQVVALVVLFTALAVIAGIQVLPLLGGAATPPPPAPLAAKSVPPAPAASATRRPATSSRGTAGRGRATGQTAPARNGAGVLSGVEEVHLAKLEQEEPEPIDGHRNPFGFGADPKSASASSASAKGGGANGLTPMQAPPAPPVAMGPPPVPPPPPITLKFFGVITAPGRIGRVAALGDGKFVYHGREGEIVEGRYRIVKIAEESIQMEYVDGRGRQTIRLSGK
jgi:hypothetical protein